MSTSSIGEILATELAKISDQIVFYCIILAVCIVILGLIIGAIKNAFRKIFKK